MRGVAKIGESFVNYVEKPLDISLEVDTATLVYPCNSVYEMTNSRRTLQPSCAGECPNG